ncbi:nuclear transport factor 2 family protein [Nocardioides alcanivorans]|uniref:nuclear transport factor 2 family protein n=1 Tax=Nocardioides alcanivorans TaxID=2897352 RepID=UPI001F16180F|nr:nuclear transport factor 2 family protein [Nocardioides alcanivorans]
MDVEEHGARLEIMDLISEYTVSNDRGEWDRMERIWAEDAVMKVPGVGLGRYEGREAITARFRNGDARTLRANLADTRDQAQMSVSRHHLTSTRLTFVDSSCAEGVTYYLVITDAGYDHSGTYEDRFVKIDGRWLIAERTTQVEHVAPDSYYGGLLRAAVTPS